MERSAGPSRASSGAEQDHPAQWRFSPGMNRRAPGMNRRALHATSLIFWTILIGLFVWSVPDVSAEWRPGDTPFGELITAVARGEGLAPSLVEAVVAVESAFSPRAVSGKGAMGLMQLMPQTARLYGVSNAFDPRQNLSGGT